MIRKLKLIMTVLLKFIATIIYKVICIWSPIKPNRVVFVTPRHTALKDNLYYLFGEMKNTNPELEYMVITTDTYAGKLKGLQFIKQLCRDYYYLASARFFLLDDYYLPLYLVNVREGTEVVQLWHASGPLKKVGLSLRGHPDGPNESYLKVVPIHSNYDKLIVNSDEEIEYYAEAFGMAKEKIYALGSPRTDALFTHVHVSIKKAKFLKKYPQFKDKELILYAPTFRGRSTNLSPYVPKFDLDKLIPQLLENNKVILFTLHPYMNENEDLVNKTNSDAIFWNQGEYEIEELLVISDALISDYSSVIYDFAILEKPIALYCYDYEEYNRQRGFYVDIKKLLPKTYFEKERDLLNWIVSDTKNTDEVKRLKKKNFKFQDGLAAKRIIQSIFQ